MRVPHFGHWLMERIQNIRPSAKLWHHLVAALFIAGGAVLAYAKIKSRMQ